MDQSRKDIGNNEGQFKPLATCPDSINKEEKSNHAAYRAANDAIHLNSGGRCLSDNAILNTRAEILNIGISNDLVLYK